MELKLEGSPFLLAHVLSSVGHLLNFSGQFFMNSVCGGLGFGGDSNRINEPMDAMPVHVRLDHVDSFLCLEFHSYILQIHVNM